MQAQALVLDVGYQPIGTQPWEKVIVWILERAAEVVEEHPDKYIRTVNWQVKMPSVVRMLTPIKKKKAVKFSRHNVFARDGGRCGYCATRLTLRTATYDHVIPRSQGGKTEWSNVVISCVPCNQKKGGRTPAQAGMTLLSHPHRPKKLPEMPRAIHFSPGMPEAWRAYLRDAIYWDAPLEE